MNGNVIEEALRQEELKNNFLRKENQ